MGTGRGFVRLGSLRHGDILATCRESSTWALPPAGNRLPATSNIPQSIVDVSVLGLRDASRADVYNLTVEDAREFYANGILTHNCDALRYGIMTWKMQGVKPRQEVIAEAVRGLDPTSAAIAYERFGEETNRGPVLRSAQKRWLTGARR